MDTRKRHVSFPTVAGPKSSCTEPLDRSTPPAHTVSGLLCPGTDYPSYCNQQVQVMLTLCKRRGGEGKRGAIYDCISHFEKITFNFQLFPRAKRAPSVTYPASIFAKTHARPLKTYPVKRPPNKGRPQAVTQAHRC